MILTKEYIAFAEWAAKNDKKPHTRQQVEWAEFFLQHPDIIAKIGDIQTVLTETRQYIRDER